MRFHHIDAVQFDPVVSKPVFPLLTPVLRLPMVPAGFRAGRDRGGHVSDVRPSRLVAAAVHVPPWLPGDGT